MTQKQFIYPLRVHIEDTDCNGIVYHSNYLNFMERARSEWLLHLKLDKEWQSQHGILFAVHSANIEFIKPARVHDKLEVLTSVKSMRRASMVFDQIIRLASDPDIIFSKAEITIVCVDNNMKVRGIPSDPIFRQICV